MVKTAYLRIYEPEESFSPAERNRWVHQRQESPQERGVAHRWLLYGSLPSVRTWAEAPEGALVKRAGGKVYLCPWRTRLRMLAGLVAFRDSMPSEVAEAFVPERQAGRAAAELAAFGRERPDVRTNMVHANWHVPIRWFSCFEGSERILTEDCDGLRIRYETSLLQARARVERAVAILEESWIDDGVVDALKDLQEWLEEFEVDGILELDYGSVADMIPPDELADDHSAADLARSLDALEAGDLQRAGKLFADVTARWTKVRALEVVN
ncbi:MAG TPA: hypothetical protein VE975_03075 [Actinomycetota bacterium]|jgi:hypothetical protein|nr:hypothetical protein [Actinomycetota bacterium]